MGAQGNDGAAGTLVHSVTEPKGSNCPAGGTKLEFGADDDGDGQLSAAEVDATTYVCNGTDGAEGMNGANGIQGVNGSDGADGHASLVTITPDGAGGECANGGHKVETGLDDGLPSGTASNGVLEHGEVEQTSYLCHAVDQYCTALSPTMAMAPPRWPVLTGMSSRSRFASPRSRRSRRTMSVS